MAPKIPIKAKIIALLTYGPLDPSFNGFDMFTPEKIACQHLLGDLAVQEEDSPGSQKLFNNN